LNFQKIVDRVDDKFQALTVGLEVYKMQVWEILIEVYKSTRRTVYGNSKSWLTRALCPYTQTCFIYFLYLKQITSWWNMSISF